MKPNHVKLFENYLRELNLFQEEEIQFISEKSTFRKFKKSEYFVEKGNKCSDFIFVTKGIFRSFFGLKPTSVITFGFTFERNFLTSLSSYITEEESEENIQAIEDSEALVLSKSDLFQLESQYPGWNKFLKIYSEKQFFRMEKIIRRIYQEDAETRYMNLIQTQPHYFQRLPLSYIASYLGITQRHRSRIRKGIMIKEKGVLTRGKAAIKILD